MRKHYLLLLLIMLCSTFSASAQTKIASEYCGEIAPPKVDHEYCSPIINWTTAENGDVVITLKAGEGDEDATYFRGARGMNGQFSLSEGNIADYFNVPTAYTDKYTFTLSLKDPANKPAAGVKINYDGQIECRSSIHGNDWSDYQFSFTYGAVCANDAAVTGVSLDQTSATLPINLTLTLKANVQPANAAVKDVQWTSSDPAIATVDGGVVTPLAKGKTVITATTAEGGFTATCEVEVVDAKLVAPDNAPDDPTHDAANVKVIYSPKYNVSCNHGAWGGSVSFDKQDAGIKVVMSSGGYVGFVDFPALDCSSMQTFHADVWVEDDASMRFVPITGQAEQGVMRQLKGGQWNSIEIAMDEGAWANTTNWTNVYQLKIDNAPNLTFWINNIYFYRVPTGDTEAPVNVAAQVTATSLTGAVISVSAEDNSGQVLYTVMNGEQTVGTGTAASGASANIKISGLTPGAPFALTVVAKDAEGNVAEGVTVNGKTNSLPAAQTPKARKADDVRNIYSDAYDNVLAHDYIKNNWSGIKYTEVDINGNHSLVYDATTERWVAFGENNDGGNAIIAAEGYNNGTDKGLDVSAMEYLHVDIYSETAIPGGPVSTINDDRLAVFTHDGNGWQSYDFPLDVLAADKLDNVRWMKFEGMNNTDEFVIDNVYFYKKSAVTITDYAITGDYNGWAGENANCIQFVETDTENILQATASEFKTGQWGFKVRKGDAWSGCWGSAAPIFLDVPNTLVPAQDGNNIHINKEQNKLILKDAVFTLDITDADAPVLTVTCSSVQPEADVYSICGVMFDWQLDKSAFFTYNPDAGNYTLSLDKFEGEFKILKNNQWGEDNELCGDKDLLTGEYNLVKKGSNAGIKSGNYIKNAVLTLTITDNGAILNIEGTVVEEHSYGLVGAFQGDWSAMSAPLFEEQADGTWALDMTDFPGGEMFKVSIDKTWTCFLAFNGVTTLESGVAYVCDKADNGNNFMIGEAGKNYDAHFVLSVANGEGTLTVTYKETDPSSAAYYYTSINHTPDPNSYALLSVFNNGDGTMTVRLSKDASKNSQTIDFLQVEPYAKSAGADVTGAEGADELQVVITPTDADIQNGYVTLSVLWSTPDWLGRWMVTDIKADIDSYVYKYIEVEPGMSYGTTYLTEDVRVPVGNVAYTATIDQDTESVKLTAISTGIIPAYTPVVIKGTSQYYPITNIGETSASKASKALPNNVLVGTLVEVEDVTDKFILGIADGKVGFYPSTAKLAANKAYIPKAPFAPLDGYPLYDPSTAIQNIELSTSDAIYTVGGIRVNSAKMSKGLYIQNGKKYVVK